MKLDELLGKELYDQVQAKIDEVNSKEPDKLKHVRYADLSEGEYVGKGKFDAEIEKLNKILLNKDSEITTANALIEDLKKGTKGNEELQGKITGYETQVQQLQAQLAETQMESAIKVALLSEKAIDVDYLTYKLNEKLKEDGKTLELDENGNIKDWKSYSDGLKTQFPNMYESSSAKKIEENRLPGSEGDPGKAEPKTLAEALQQRYETTHND